MLLTRICMVLLRRRRVTPRIRPTAPGDTNPSDATGSHNALLKLV